MTMIENEHIPGDFTGLIGSLGGMPGMGAQEILPGVYEISHFGGSHMLPSYEHYPEGLSVGSYGVCDSPKQLLEKCPELLEPGRDFLVTVTPILRDSQPAEGGWRWHKWGEYIGEKEPTTEYLHDEPEIDKVWVYHIYEMQ